MNKNAFDNYLSSKEYSEIEMDTYYIQLSNFLQAHLTKDIYLEVEELLHLEILTKVEAGFKAGMKINQNELL